MAHFLSLKATLNVFYLLELPVDGGGLIRMFFPVTPGWGGGYVYRREGWIQPNKKCLFFSKLTKGNEELRTIILGDLDSESEFTRKRKLFVF